MRTGDGGERGISPVVSVLLMVVVTVVLAALVGGLALGLGGETEQAGPSITVSPDRLAADGSPDQVVRLTHENGETVEAASLEIVVILEKTGARTRLVDLPVTSNTIDPANVEGDDILDQSSGATTGAISDISPDTDGEWSAGETIEFRIKTGDDSYDIAPGDEVRVQVVHTDSGSIVVDETLVAQ